MRVSYIVLFYNHERYVADCLHSLVQQTVPPDEVIIHDDFSTDGTWEAIQKFIAETGFPKSVKVVPLRAPFNHGATASFNRAISFATGDLLFLNGGDDINFPERTAVITKLFAADCNVKAVFSNLVKVDREGATIGVYFNTPPKPAMCRRDVVLLRDVWAIGASMAVRRELVADHWSVPLRHVSSDGVLAFRAVLTGELSYFDQPTVLYRHHDQNISQNLTIDKKLDFICGRPRYLRELIENAHVQRDSIVALCLVPKLAFAEIISSLVRLRGARSVIKKVFGH